MEDFKTWKPLFFVGGIAALVLVLITIIQIIVFMAWPPPYTGSVTEWFAYFQNNSFLGLIGFELLMVIYVIVSIPITLSLFMLLKQTHPSLTLLYLALSFIGIMAFIQARPAVEMLKLADEYAIAPTEGQKAQLASAGQTFVTTFHGTSFHISYILGSFTGLIISWVMLKSTIFNKTTAYVRMVSSVCDFGLYVPGIGMYISLFSVFFLLAWDVLIARKLFQFSQ